jgi:GWxTD domain-containing protein
MNRTVLSLAAMICICAGATPAQIPSSFRGIDAKRPSMYERWIDEDVHWIISPSEEAQYRALKTNEDRDRFVTEFWLQRDPTPGTPENEFKEEHYRRLAYSNLHFAEKDEAGWSTDRGRVYVKAGPPDAVLVLPGRAHLMLLWRYNTRQHHDYRFVDECDCGHYRLEDSALR